MQPELSRVLAAVERVADAERQLAEARQARAAAIREARATGLSLAAIGKALGLSRQRIAAMSES